MKKPAFPCHQRLSQNSGHGNSNGEGAIISSIRFRLVTASKLAWPASSDAAVLAVSCLSESPIRVAVGRSERFTGNKTAEHSLSTVMWRQWMCSTYGSGIWVLVMQTWNSLMAKVLKLIQTQHNDMTSAGLSSLCSPCFQSYSSK